MKLACLSCAVNVRHSAVDTEILMLHVKKFYDILRFFKFFMAIFESTICPQCNLSLCNFSLSQIRIKY